MKYKCVHSLWASWFYSWHFTDILYSGKSAAKWNYTAVTRDRFDGEFRAPMTTLSMSFEKRTASVHKVLDNDVEDGRCPQACRPDGNGRNCGVHLAVFVLARPFPGDHGGWGEPRRCCDFNYTPFRGVSLAQTVCASTTSTVVVTVHQEPRSRDVRVNTLNSRRMSRNFPICILTTRVFFFFLQPK